MNKISTLVLVASIALATPAFAATLHDVRNGEVFSAQASDNAAPAVAKPAMKAAPAKKDAAAKKTTTTTTKKTHKKKIKADGTSKTTDTSKTTSETK